MILTASSEPVPAPHPGSTVIASLDVEWSKNYGKTSCQFTSAYVEHAGETQDLISSTDAAATRMLARAGIVAGHQLCSDLAVILRAAATPQPAVTRLREAWHRRISPGRPGVTDTRYDTADLLTGSSRRLADICAELGLDVTQPELRATSMTALHWLQTGDSTSREKISVLNLRHSLSAALLAARAARIATWDTPLNVSRMLAATLGQAFGWTSNPQFRQLLGDRR